MQIDPNSIRWDDQPQAPRVPAPPVMGGRRVIGDVPPSERRAERDQQLQEVRTAQQLEIERQRLALAQQEEARRQAEFDKKQNPAVAMTPEVQAERRARITTSLKNLRDLYRMTSGTDMATGSIVGQESFLAGEDFLGASGWFNQRANDVAGAAQMVQGDLINQVRNEMQMSGAPIGARAADTEKEAARIAASIANLAQTQDEAQFRVGLDRAREYYLRRYVEAGGDPGELLTAALADGATYEELEGLAKGMGKELDRETVMANINARDRGEDVSAFVPDPNDPNRPSSGGGAPPSDGNGPAGMAAKTLYNTVAGYAQGAGEALVDVPQMIGSLPAIGMNSLIGGTRALYNDVTGNPQEAARIRAETGQMNDRVRSVTTPVANAFNALAPAPQGYETQRDVARFAGGFLVPGPKGARAPVRAPSPAAPARAVPGMIDNAAEVVSQGAQRGVRVFTTDIKPPQSAMGRMVKQTVPEKIPFAGMSGPRASQQAERVQAVKDLVDEFGGDSARNLMDGNGAVESIAKTLGQTRANRIATLTGAKDSVIDGIRQPFVAVSNDARSTGSVSDIPPLEYGTGSWIIRDRKTGEAVLETFEESVARKVNQERYEVLTARQHLARLNGAEAPSPAQAPRQIGNETQTAAPNTMRAISEQIAKLKQIDPEEFAPVIERLERFGERINSGASLRVVEEQRRLLGELFTDPNLARIKTRGQQAINAVYGPLREDMGNFIEATAGVGARNRWAKANEELSAMAGELSSARFRNVLRDTDTSPEAVGRILFNNGNPSDVKRLVGNLPPAGQKKVQAALLQRAFDSAGGAEGVSVERFLNNIKRNSETFGIAFEGQDRQALEGVRRLLEATRRGAEAGANIRTGEQNMPAVLGMTATGALGAAGGISTLGVGGLLARLYESPVMRNHLLRLAGTRQGSPAESKALQVLMRSAAPIVNEWQQNLGRAVNDNAAGALAAEGQNPQKN